MTITSRDDWVASAKQPIPMVRTSTRTTVAGGWFSVFDVAGHPGAGTLAIGNTANGTVPTDAIAGYPILDSFGAGADGRLGLVDFGCTVASRLRLYDRVFAAGAYAFNASTTLTGIPSYAGRVPGGNYSGLQIWVEQVTAATGNQAVSVTYTNQAGVTSRSTGAVGIGAAPTVGRCWQLPLQSGDSGVQQITGVAGSVATVGTFNVMVLRSLWRGFVRVGGDSNKDELTRGGMRVVYADSAIYKLVMAPSGTSSGLPDLEIDIVNK